MTKDQLENVGLSTLLEGAADILFLEALSEKVLPNIFDVNCNPKKERTVTLTVRFKPTLNREGTVTGADTFIDDPKVKLVGRDSIAGHILLGKIDDGYQAKEIRQLNINDPMEEVTIGQTSLKSVKKGAL